MEKYRAIPDGYMRIGEIARKAGVTVRTLQYYDKEGLLSPSAESEGGFRLYTDKDMVKLMQILLMKELGFSLSEIKKRLVSLDTPADVLDVLTEHAAGIRRKIDTLSESLEAIEALKEEVAQMEVVDFKKYAAILVSLQMKNEYYWIVKHLDDDTLNHLGAHLSREKAEELMKTFNRLRDEAVEFQQTGVTPESERGQIFAKELWETMMELTDGDMGLMLRFNEQVQKVSGVWGEKLIAANSYMQLALESYFRKPMLEGIAEHLSSEKTKELLEVFNGLGSRVMELQKNSIRPESEEGQAFAKLLWETIMELTGGDMNAVAKLNQQVQSASSTWGEWTVEVNGFMQTALEIYLSKQGNSSEGDM